MEYFNNLLDLLQAEREADRQQFLKLTAMSSAAERRSNGMTWYPVAIRGIESGRGDYLSIEIERTTHQDISHQFRFGAAAVLFSNHDPENDRVEGIVAHYSGNKIKLNLRTDELPDWSRSGKLGLDLLFDQNSYDEMEAALKTAAVRAADPGQGALIRILSGMQAPEGNILPVQTVFPGLNSGQQQAVRMIAAAPQLSVVHGPPGTGKTTTLVQAIEALLAADGQQVLVVAPSNTAVDLLSEKLAARGIHVLRAGHPARVSDTLSSLTLDHKLATHPMMKTLRTLRKQAAQFRQMAHQYKRNFGRAEQEQRKALFSEAQQCGAEAMKTEEYMIEDLLNKAQVIAATLVGSGNYAIRKRKYTTVVIDEAGQALEPACWIPILKADKVVFAGDHLQLPPTLKSDAAARAGLSRTLLEKCVSLYPECVTLLEQQYRMHEKIMGYPSAVFYQGKLTASPSVAGRLLFPGDEPLVFIDTAGCSFEEKAEGTSTTNPDEAVFLLRHLSQFAGQLLSTCKADDFPGCAVISPYKQQVQLLQSLLPHDPVLAPLAAKISINTIDSFQGQERDIVYIGLTRSNTGGNIGFLSDIRRMNVAMTRAKMKLVVIGDSATLARSGFYSGFIAYATANGVYHSAWEFIS